MRRGEGAGFLLYLSKKYCSKKSFYFWAEDLGSQKDVQSGARGEFPRLRAQDSNPTRVLDPPFTAAGFPPALEMLALGVLTACPDITRTTQLIPVSCLQPEEPLKPCVTPHTCRYLKVTHSLWSMGQAAAFFSPLWEPQHWVHIVLSGSRMGFHKMLWGQEMRWIWRTRAAWVSAQLMVGKAGRNLRLCCSTCFTGWFLLGLEDWGEGWSVALLSSHSSLV